MKKDALKKDNRYFTIWFAIDTTPKVVVLSYKAAELSSASALISHLSARVHGLLAVAACGARVEWLLPRRVSTRRPPLIFGPANLPTFQLSITTTQISQTLCNMSKWWFSKTALDFENRLTVSQHHTAGTHERATAPKAVRMAAASWAHRNKAVKAARERYLPPPLRPLPAPEYPLDTL